MAETIKSAQAGSMEKGDILITLDPGQTGSGINIELHCSAEAEFGRQIRQTIVEVLQQNGISDALVQAQDKGAMDFVVRARTQTAAKRARG